MFYDLQLVKTARDAEAAKRLAREALWLRELAEVPALEGQVPRLLEQGTDRSGAPYLVISIPPDTGETRAFTTGHANFLAALGKARFRVGDFEHAGKCQWIQRSLPADQPLLHEAYEDCEKALLYWTGPYVLAQGDFAPWNIRTLGSQLFVFDWGSAHADASPLDDVLHYLMIQRRLKTVPLLRRALLRAREFALAAYPEWSWRREVIGALTLVYLLGVILHRGLNRADPVVAAYWRLLEKRSTWMKENCEMSAAATAAGYLYASGRLRGRAAREQEEHQPQQPEKADRPKEKIRVAVMPPREEPKQPAAPRRTPKIEYRTRRRWTPE